MSRPEPCSSRPRPRTSYPCKSTGPDDPRNGLSLCPRHHWAFDAGLFTVTDGRSVRVSPAVQRAQRQRFDLEEYDGERLVGASDECFLPAPGGARVASRASIPRGVMGLSLVPARIVAGYTQRWWARYPGC